MFSVDFSQIDTELTKFLPWNRKLLAVLAQKFEKSFKIFESFFKTDGGF